MGPLFSLPRSQGPATGPDPYSDDISPRLPFLLLQDGFYIINPVRLMLVGGLVHF